MTDVFSKEKRSEVMRKIRSKGNRSTELRMIDIFKKNGISGWRRHYPVIGHPDFVFIKKRIAIFVDGCFWHGHDCRNTRPSDNAEYWERKRKKNIEHDKSITSRFQNRGWIVIRIWECELKKKNEPELVQKLKAAIK